MSSPAAAVPTTALPTPTTPTPAPPGERPGADSADSSPVLRGLPGWVLRAAVLVLSVAVVLVAPGPGVPVGIVVTLLAAAVATAVAPASPAPTILGVLVVATRVFSGGDSIGPRLFATALGLYAVWLLTALSQGVPVVSRIDPHAFDPSARRFAVVAVAFVPVFAAARLAGPGLGSGWLFVLAGVSATALLVAALASGRIRNSGEPPPAADSAGSSGRPG